MHKDLHYSEQAKEIQISFDDNHHHLENPYRDTNMTDERAYNKDVIKESTTSNNDVQATKIQALTRGYLFRHPPLISRHKKQLPPRWHHRQISGITMTDFEDSTLSLLSFVSSFVSSSTRGGILTSIEQRCDEDEGMRNSSTSLPKVSGHASEKFDPNRLPPTPDVEDEEEEASMECALNAPNRRPSDTPIICPTRQPSARGFLDVSEHPSEKSVPVLLPTPDVENEDVDDDESFCTLPSLRPKKDGFGHHESSKMLLDGDTLTALTSCFQVFGRDRPVRQPLRTMSPKTVDGGVRRPERKDSLDPITHDVVRSDVRVTRHHRFRRLRRLLAASPSSGGADRR
jgi:hypothetical protein